MFIAELKLKDAGLSRDKCITALVSLRGSSAGLLVSERFSSEVGGKHPEPLISASCARMSLVRISRSVIWGVNENRHIDRWLSRRVPDFCRSSM